MITDGFFKETIDQPPKKQVLDQCSIVNRFL